MPRGFGYPVNHTAWTPISLRASYGALEGEGVSVIGRLATGVTWAQADAELRVVGERAAAALPVTHQYLEPRVMRLGETSDGLDAATFAMRNLPVLLVLSIACVSVGTLVYARTAIREGKSPCVACSVRAERASSVNSLSRPSCSRRLGPRWVSSPRIGPCCS